MKDSFKESLRVMAICYGLLLVLFLCFGCGIILPILYYSPENISYIFLATIGVSWIITLFLAIIGCDRLCGYFIIPKSYRGNFWFIKEIRRFKTFNLYEIEKEAQKK